METSGDPVQAALEERRARRVEAHRLDRGLTIADRCRDAAERRLRVRAFLIGNTTVAGIALAADDALLTIESTNGAGPTRLAYVAVDALVRLTVAEVRTGPRAAPLTSPDAPPLPRAIAELARDGSDLTVVLRDGSTVRGPLVSLGDRTIGFGAPGASIDWVDPEQIVSVAQIARPPSGAGHHRR